MPRCALISCSDPRWTELTQRGHSAADIYSTPQWSIAEARAQLPSGSVKCQAFYWETPGLTVLLPLLLRPVPESSAAGAERPWIDATSPYGFPGLVVQSDLPQDRIVIPSAFGRDLLETLRQERVVSLFLRLHPLLNNQISWDECNDTFSAAEITAGSPTVFLDLSGSKAEFSGGEGDIPRSFHKSHRWGIRKLRGLGYTTHINQPHELDSFIDLYYQTMIRVGAKPMYFFPRSYFYRLVELLPDSIFTSLVRCPDGEVCAAGLFLEYNGISQYHLSATAREHLPHAPGKLLVTEMSKFFAARGNRVFHLGGGIGGDNDPLLTYKARFSTHRGLYKLVKKVVNPEVYQALSEVKLDLGQFFPQYRAKHTSLFYIGLG